MPSLPPNQRFLTQFRLILYPPPVVRTMLSHLKVLVG